MLEGYWLNHDAKGTRGDLCFFGLYWVVSFLFQRSLTVLSLLLYCSFSVSYTKGEKWFVFWGGGKGVFRGINIGVLVLWGRASWLASGQSDLHG